MRQALSVVPLFTTLLILFTGNGTVFPQSSCSEPAALPFDTASYLYGHPNTGLFMASCSQSPDSIHTLVLCIEFLDDSTDIGGTSATGLNRRAWPFNTIPRYLSSTNNGQSDIIDKLWGGSVLSGRKYSLTTFFREMSGGRLTLDGEAFYVRTPYPASFYTRDSAFPITYSEALNAGHLEDTG